MVKRRHLSVNALYYYRMRYLRYFRICLLIFLLHCPKERTEPEKRRKLYEERHHNAVEEFLASDIIPYFNKLVTSYTKYVTSSVWKFEIGSSFVAYVTDFTNLPRITSCIKIDDQMHVNVYQNGYHVPATEFAWLLGSNNILSRWSQFENLLKRAEASTNSSKIFLQEATLSCIQQLLEVTEDTESSIKLTFLKDQFELICCGNKAARRYSPRMMVNAFMIHTLSPACYDALRTNYLLVLPQESRLIQVTQAFDVSLEDVRKNKHFLKRKADTLNDREKFIIM